jgi:hypothetical protein
MVSPAYRPRKPKASLLWQCLFWHFSTFRGRYALRFQKHYGFLRPIISEVVNKFLDCGDFEHGFARILYDHCKKEHLPVFSCKGRWTDPPAAKRRSSRWWLKDGYGRVFCVESLRYFPWKLCLRRTGTSNG